MKLLYLMKLILYLVCSEFEGLKTIKLKKKEEAKESFEEVVLKFLLRQILFHY